ncbi:MAG: 4'-phosphopantetheinyl transferase superfamily protein [Gilliamella sp.]|nr:4'-phosphopantetheinyl transferase superfamily protein [Gilliamella sp.]
MKQKIDYSSYIKNISKKQIPNFSGICYECSFYTENYSDLIATKLLEVDISDVRPHAVKYRKAEFFAGRYLARKALEDCDKKLFNIRIGNDGSPLWPEKFVGSISHCKEIAICTIAYKKNIKSIGVDVENYIENDNIDLILNDVLTKSEYRFHQSSASLNSIIFTLIFSAKESLFKALSREISFLFDFRYCQLVNINFSNYTFTIEIIKKLSPTLLPGVCFDGFFELCRNHVFTIIFEYY